MKHIPRDERRVTDKQFLSCFDPGRPGGTGHGERDLVEHFRTRKTPVWFFDLRGSRRRSFSPPWAENTGGDSDALSRANHALENRFILSGGLVWDFGKDLKWHTSEMRGLGSAPSVFKRCNWMRDLATAWVATRDWAYAEKLAQLIDQWLRDWPLVVDDEFGPESALLSKSDGHKAMPTAFRVLSWLDVLYTGVLFEPRFPRQTAFDLLKSMWFTALQYRRYASSTYQPANHHLWERGTAPYIFGTMLPEFPEVRRLAEQGKPVICRHTEDSFLADGCYEERSTSYAFAALRMFLVPHRLARLNRASVLDTRARARLRRCGENAALITLPNGAQPDLGDGHPRPGSNARMFGHIAGGFGSRKTAEVLRRLHLLKHLEAGPRKVLGSLERTELPLTVYHPRGGYFVARDRWSVGASAMSFSVPGPGLMHNHAHDDALHLQLVVRGVPILGTPMSELYSYLNQDRYFGTRKRGHFFAMTSHNLVLAQGEPLRTLESLAPRTSWGAVPVPVDTTWSKRKGGIRVTGSHTGYPGTTLARSMDYVYRRGWTIRDLVTGEAGKSHVARWCFEYGVELSKEGETYLARREDVLLRISFRSPGKCDPRMHRDQQWLGKNPLRPETPAPWILDVRFGGSGDDELVTEMEIVRGAP